MVLALTLGLTLLFPHDPWSGLLGFERLPRVDVFIEGIQFHQHRNDREPPSQYIA